MADETGLELYYRLALRPWLEVTPNLQLLVDPGARERAESTVVATLRLRVAWRAPGAGAA